MPPTLKIVGPTRSIPALTAYLTTFTARAKAIGLKIAVFGSGGARNIPDGYSHAAAKDEILEFLAILGPLAQSAGLTIAIEPLNRRECNVLNSLAEAADYARQLNHPAIKVLLDTFHHWAENLPLKEVEDALPLLAHVHLAEHTTRTAPGTAGSNYRPLFHLLKSAQYPGRLSLECTGLDLATPEGRTTATTAATYVRNEWTAA
jgi:sugar phosphate isomerase/epimerase